MLKFSYSSRTIYAFLRSSGRYIIATTHCHWLSISLRRIKSMSLIVCKQFTIQNSKCSKEISTNFKVWQTSKLTPPQLTVCYLNVNFKSCAVDPIINNQKIKRTLATKIQSWNWATILTRHVCVFVGAITFTPYVLKVIDAWVDTLNSSFSMCISAAIPLYYRHHKSETIL